MPEPLSRSGSRVNILLVDDQPSNLLALDAVLQDLGHTLVLAHSGEEALQRLREDTFALIILDVLMPGLDGFETARRIRTKEAFRHTPIIFLTAFESDLLSVEKAYSLGAVDYLVKPLVPVIVRAKVAGFVELFQKSEQLKRQAERLREAERRQFEAKLAEENERLRQSEDRFRFLSEASKALASSLDYETTLRSVAELTVPTLADWCAVDVLLEDQSIRRVAVVHGDPVKVELGYELLRRYPLRLEMPEGTVIRSGQSALHAEISDPMLVRFARDADHLAILRQLNLRSTMVVPLAARGRILGSISLVSDDSSDRRYGPEDLALAEELGRRAGLSVDNARLYRSAHDALHEKEELLALLDTLQTNAPVGFAFVDRQYRYVRINEAMSTINGKPVAEHLGHRVEEILPELWPTLEPMYRHVLEKEEAVVNREVSGETAAAPGQVRHWLASYYPVRIAAEVAGVGVLVSEITERKRAEEALRESEQRFARFMQHLPGLAWIKDDQGRYAYVNDAAARAFRLPREQLYGKTDQGIFPPETAQQFQENDARALASEAGVQVIEELLHTDGIIHQSVVSKFPIIGADGVTRFVGGMAIDITERFQMEEALKEADRRKDEFLAMLAHELRNPLAPLRNALHILKMPSADSVSLAQARNMMDRQLQHLVRLVDDLLDVSRIMRNKIELRSEPIELRQIVERAVETAQPVLDAQGHQLDLELPTAPAWLQGDSVRLAQVIANLLNNAAKYTERAGRIRLSAEREANEIVLRVRDNGIGIPPDLLPKVFDLFMQADRSLDRSQGGLGIGLTLVKRLVEMHGGKVEAQSTGPGQGSEFVVRLPAAPRGAEIEDAPADALCPSARHRVLVVDDNVDAAESTALILKLLQQEVRVAHDGPAALVAANEFRPNLVLLDIGLPTMSGYEVARRLREQPVVREAFLVALTGYGQEEDRQRSRAAGFDLHWVKPIELTILEKLLSDLKT